MASKRELLSPEVAVADEQARVHGFMATCGIGNRLMLYGGSKSACRDEGHLRANLHHGCRLHEVEWDKDMHSPITRRLVNESHNIFVALQQQAENLTDLALKSYLVKASRHYRSVIKGCCWALQSESENTSSEDEKAWLEDQQQIFQIIELIWSLCEILYIDTTPGAPSLRQLLGWIRWHFTEGKKLASEIIQDKPEKHSCYWEAIYRLLLQGCIDEALELFSKHPLHKSDSFRSLSEMMGKMPQLANFMSQGRSLPEFDIKWRHWRDECERRLEAGEFLTDSNLTTMAKILCGEEEVFYQMKDYCETWFHMLVSRLFYQNPIVKNSELQHYIQTCLDMYRGDSSHTAQLDSILVAVFEFNINQMIRDCSTYLGSWWFTSHLADLFYHSGHLEPQKLPQGVNLREYLLLEYASSLMSHKSLWAVAIHYFDFCPDNGSDYLGLYLERIPLDTEVKAHKLLHICEKRGLQEHAKSICKVMGKKCLLNNRVGQALNWFLKSKDSSYATVLSERILTEYSETGQFSNLDLLENLGSSMFLSSKLTFLGQYREFHKLYEDGDIQEAAILLVSLLSARLAPKAFWVTLLCDALPLLEAEQVVISSQQTYELMHCVEELTKEASLVGDENQKKMLEVEKTKLSNICLALTRNLDRAIIVEGSVKPF